ncbi:MAG: hypothetical protein HOP13_01265 [Alphaproteobacteria bacterium]|nr:hypothetical protein [Alphaproteobacteria bacterium]
MRQLAIVGLPQDDIAKLARCSPKTLRKHFRRELDEGGAEANALVAGFLFQAAKAGNVAAQIFWLKTRSRWQPPAETSADTAKADTPESDDKIIENMKARMRLIEKDDDNDPIA